GGFGLLLGSEGVGGGPEPEPADQAQRHGGGPGDEQPARLRPAPGQGTHPVVLGGDLVHGGCGLRGQPLGGVGGGGDGAAERLQDLGGGGAAGGVLVQARGKERAQW